MLCPPGTEEHWGFCVGSLDLSASQMSHFGWGLQLETDFRSVTTTSQNWFCSLWSAPATERLRLNKTTMCKSWFNLPTLQIHTQQEIIMMMVMIIISMEILLYFWIFKFLGFEHNDLPSPSAEDYFRKVFMFLLQLPFFIATSVLGNSPLMFI